MHTPTHSSPARNVNANTLLFGGPPPPVDRDAIHRAFHLATALAAQNPAPHLVGHRLIWTCNAAFAAVDLPAADAAYQIVGRHTHCDFVLDADPLVANRHVVVRSVMSAEGELTLRVLDLHTATGFRLEDGATRRSIVARGPLAFVVGQYTLVALPAGSLPASMPQPFFEEMAGPYRSPGRRPMGTSHIGILPGIAELGDLSAIGGDTFAFSLERPGRGRQTVLVSEAELERGVVIGRSPKAHPQLLQLMDHSVSRMHVLLVREGRDTFAIDLCSMNGTWLGWDRIRRVRLAPGMMLRFGDAGNVGLVWHGRG